MDESKIITFHQIITKKRIRERSLDKLWKKDYNKYLRENKIRRKD